MKKVSEGVEGWMDGTGYFFGDGMGMRDWGLGGGRGGREMGNVTGEASLACFNCRM